MSITISTRDGQDTENYYGMFVANVNIFETWKSNLNQTHFGNLTSETQKTKLLAMSVHFH